MTKIDFENTKCDFDNGQTKWYREPELQKYLETQQAQNLPVLKGVGCFAVKGKSSKGKDVEDLVLIDFKQDILAVFPYTISGFEQMEARINILKISQNFDKHDI